MSVTRAEFVLRETMCLEQWASCSQCFGALSADGHRWGFSVRIGGASVLSGWLCCACARDVEERLSKAGVMR